VGSCACLDYTGISTKGYINVGFYENRMKLGLGHSYDDVELLSIKSRAYIDLTKPASSVGVAFGYLLASLFYHLYYDLAVVTNLLDMFAVSLAIFMAHSASQSLNMAEDAEMDRETPHKQNRPIPSGVVSEDEARALSWIASGWAISLAFLVDWGFGVVVLILLFFGVFYNLDPIRAKERIISIPWQAASRGLLSFPAVWIAYGGVWSPIPWILGLFMFFYVMGFQNSADIIDREVDEEYGISTFVVEYGVEGTFHIALVCTTAMMAVIGFSTLVGILPLMFIWMLLIIPFCMVMLYYMWTQPYAVSETTGNHPAWLWFYIGMVLCVSIPLIAEATPFY
jgi:4-hydroxybenzoate polyprenyltransferase